MTNLFIILGSSQSLCLEFLIMLPLITYVMHFFRSTVVALV